MKSGGVDPRQNRECRPQGVHDAGDKPGWQGPDLESLGEPDDTPKPSCYEESDPDSLGDPGGDHEDMPQREERRDGEGVSLVLILEKPEPAIWIPQIQQVTEHGDRVGCEVQLRVDELPTELLGND